jgi:4-hydroxybutyrate CoA-transferase
MVPGASRMRTVGPRDVIAALRGARAVSSPGCGTPSTLLEIIGAHAEDVHGLSLFSGMLLGDYPFVAGVENGHISYGTWHVMPPIRRLVAEGTVGFYPVRASQVPRLLGDLAVDTALVRVSPPDRHGFCSLGPSVSYPRGAIRRARTVIAEIDPSVPRTRGESEVHLDEIDLAIDSQVPMPEYRRATADEVSRSIARHLVELLPENPTIQIGIGGIPEAFADQLLADRAGGLRFAGMATDGMADLFEAGLLDLEPRHGYPAIMSAELMGSRKLMDFADDNAALGAYSTERGITASSLWSMDRFVTINSALEIDLTGQAAAEAMSGKQISGVGGSIDFTESALHSSGGLRVIALASADVRRNTSKIVAQLTAGTPVTLPRHSIDWVVTEHGAVQLGSQSLTGRAEALRSISHPTHQDHIAQEASS